MQGYADDPPDFSEKFINESLPDKAEYLTGLIDSKLLSLSDKLETLLDLWKNILRDNISIPRVLFDTLDNFTAILNEFYCDFKYIYDYYDDAIEQSICMFMYSEDYLNWLNITKDLSEQFLSNYHIILASGLII